MADRAEEIRQVGDRYVVLLHQRGRIKATGEASATVGLTLVCSAKPPVARCMRAH